MGFCPRCSQPVGEEEEWTAVVDPSVSGGFLRAHLVCPSPQLGSVAVEGKWAVEVLARPPRYCHEGEDVPQQGWAIQGLSQVFKDGELAGQFLALVTDGAHGKNYIGHRWEALAKLACRLASERTLAVAA